MNGEQIIESCLSSLEKTTYPNFQIHVLLNGTSDNSEKIIKKHDVKIYKSESNLGFTGGFNLLVKKMFNTDSEYIVSINNDTEVEPNWLSELVEFAEMNDADICQPKIKSMKDKNYFEYAGAAGGFMDRYGYPFCRGRIFSTLEEDKGQYDTPLRIFWACGSCAMYKKDLFKKLGLLDESFFMYAEETDFCWRVNLSGGKIFSVPSSVVYHWGSYSVQKENMTARKEYLLHRNTLIMFFKNYSDETISQLKYRRIVLEIVSALAFPLKKFIPVSKALYWIATNREELKRKQEEAQKIRKITDDEVQGTMLDGSIAYAYFIKGQKRFNELTCGGKHG
jgi:hypothetical protein